MRKHLDGYAVAVRDRLGGVHEILIAKRGGWWVAFLDPPIGFSKTRKGCLERLKQELARHGAEIALGEVTEEDIAWAKGTSR